MKKIIFYLFLAACLGFIAAFVYVSYIVSNAVDVETPISQEGSSPAAKTQDNVYSVEVHDHFSGTFDSLEDYEDPLEDIALQMATYKVDKMILMPQPYPNLENFKMDINLLAEIAKEHDELEFFAGGESLNKMIQAAHEHPELLDQDYKDAFEQKARELAELGAIGFGEMTALHFSLSETHPFEEVEPDHPLFLLLADLAAEYDIPIDMHMEAVEEDRDFPFSERIDSSRNPDTLHANIEAFERLLDYNQDAKIIWSHAGWCNTGERTPELMSRLLDDHPNLYMSLKVGQDSEELTRPVSEDGEIKDEWLEMFAAYPDRFMIGTDHFFASDDGAMGGDKRGLENMYRVISLLPEDVEYQIRAENPTRFFGWD